MRKFSVDEAIEKYNEGLSTHEIAVHYGCSQTVIYRALKEGGVIFRSRGKAINPEKIPEIICMYKNGDPVKKIEHTLKISLTSIYHHLKKNGIPARRRFK